MMNRTSVKTLNEELKAVLAKFAADHSLAFTSNGGSFTDASFSPKVTFTEVATDGSKVISDYLTAKINWELLKMGVKLKAEDVMNKKFRIANGAVVTVIDFQAKGKYHWIVRKADGKTSRASDECMMRFEYQIAA